MKDYMVKRTYDRRPLATHVEMSHISPDPRGNQPNIAQSLRAQHFSHTHVDKFLHDRKYAHFAITNRTGQFFPRGDTRARVGKEKRKKTEARTSLVDRSTQRLKLPR